MRLRRSWKVLTMRLFLPPADALEEQLPGPQWAAFWLILVMLCCAFWSALAWALWRLWADAFGSGR